MPILLGLAKGRREVVELGTGTGWSAVVLALADRERRVRTFDPKVHEHRGRYLALAPEAARRIMLIERRGAETDESPVEFLFIDSSHQREQTVEEYRAWEPSLRPGTVVAFHDYGTWEGVTEAIEELDLEGSAVEDFYVVQC